MPSGLLLDGSSGYVDLGDHLHVEQGVFSVSGWFIRGNAGVAQEFFPFVSSDGSNGVGDGSAGVTLIMAPSLFNVGLQDVFDQNFGDSFAVGTPFHIAAVQQYSGGSPSQALLFINGVASPSNPIATAPNTYLDSTGSHANIGRFNSHGSFYYGNGQAVELCIWTRDISADVATLYNGGSILYGTQNSGPWATGLAAGYHCDETSGTTLHDFSGNGIHGTLQGGASFGTWPATFGAGNPFDSQLLLGGQA